MIKKLKNWMEPTKRLTALLLSFVMVASFAPTAAFAQGSGSGNSDIAPGASNTAPGASGLMRNMALPVGLTDVDAYWPSFRGNDTNMAITNAPLPIDSANINLKWNKRLGSGWGAAPSNQIIVDDSIIVMGGQKLFKLDIKTGDILAEGNMSQSPGYSMTSPTYGAGMIFCALSNGTVQAFSVETLESLWIYTDPLGGQSNTPVAYSDGYVYTSFWNSDTTDANFVALPITDEDPTQPDEAKAAAWSFTNKGGFYWAGAVVVGDAVIFGSDDGVNNAYSGAGAPAKVYSLDRLTGEVIGSLDIIGDQRSSIAYDRDTSKIYFTTKHGYLYSAVVDAGSGELSELVESVLASGTQSTSTPVVYKDRVYIGMGMGFKTGYFAAADAETLEQLYTIPLKGYPQCSMLMTTAYEDSTGYIYLYSTYNNNPGGISMIKVKPDGTTAEEAELIELYDAAGFKQYCTASLICGPDGTIYYKNDSSNILAVGVPKATGVVNLIASIGKVTLNSADAILIARNAYDALPDEDKTGVTNYELLTAAEAVLAQLRLQQKVDETKKLIEDIGTVTRNSGSEIRAARRAYNALTTEQKALVTNYSVLTAAERKYDKLTSHGSNNNGNRPSNPKSPVVPPAVYTPTPAAAELINKLSALLPTDTYSVAQIIELYNQYAQLTNAQKAEVINYDVLAKQMDVIGKQNHTDSATGIKVDGADWNVKLNTVPTTDTDPDYTLLAQGLGSNTLLYAWDVSLSDILTGGEYQPIGEMTLSMPVPDLGDYTDIVIAHYKEDGSVEYLDCEIIEGVLSWKVSSLSSYAVVARAEEAATPLPQEEQLKPELPTVILPEAAPTATPAAPASTLPWTWILLACAGAVAVVVAVLARSGKIFGKSGQ